MKKDLAKAQTMNYLKLACDAGAQREAMYILKSSATYGSQDTFVDWHAAAKELESLVSKLPEETTHLA